MRQRKFQKGVYKLSGWIEIFISMVLVVAIVIFSIGLIENLYDIVTTGHDRTAYFTEFLGNAFQIIIGVEFIKMLCKHTPSTVVEVLMFAMARQMVVEHTSPAENLLCVAGITILFVIRRFLFTDADKENHYQDEISEQKRHSFHHMRAKDEQEQKEG